VNEIVIRKLSMPDEMKDIERLEGSVWGDSPLPVHQTITAAKNGGVILGAFDGVQLIGFLYSFAGFNNGEVYLCSHQMGIDNAYRNRGVGYQLKMAQAKIARELGYRKIRWTYDPLESRNAYLNIRKLGAVCYDYIENCYGLLDDNLNNGLPSDRFWVTWFLDNTGAFRDQIYPNGTKHLFNNRKTLTWTLQNGIPIPEEAPFDLEGSWEHVLVPTPQNFQELKSRSHVVANEWRMFTRRLFTDAFERGWAVVDVMRDEPVIYYVLEKRTRWST
jgi:predicted GNAT superfamily acetyltransferase